MVRTCVVPGCHNRSNKPSCKGLKFYTLPTTKKVLQVWLALIGRHFSEVSFHSRICSEHFINGQKIKDSIPEIFPWQRQSVITAMTNADPHNVSSKVTSQDTSTPVLSPVDIVHHDHSYCTPLSSYPASTHLTPITPTEPSVLLSSSIVHNSTQTSLARFPFRIEDIADNGNIIHNVAALLCIGTCVPLGKFHCPIWAPAQHGILSVMHWSPVLDVVPISVMGMTSLLA